MRYIEITLKKSKPFLHPRFEKRTTGFWNYPRVLVAVYVLGRPKLEHFLLDLVRRKDSRLGADHLWFPAGTRRRHRWSRRTRQVIIETAVHTHRRAVVVGNVLVELRMLELVHHRVFGGLVHNLTKLLFVFTKVASLSIDFLSIGDFLIDLSLVGHGLVESVLSLTEIVQRSYVPDVLLIRDLLTSLLDVARHLWTFYLIEGVLLG